MMKRILPVGKGWFPDAISYQYSMLRHFNIEQIAESGQAFRFYNLAERKGFYHYYNVSMDKYVEILQQGTVVEFLTKPEWVKFWEDYFALHEEDMYVKLETEIKNSDDKPLQEGRCYAEGIRVLHQNPFETTVSFMLSSANSIHNIKLYLSRFCKCYGHFEVYKIGGYEVSYWTFPTLEDLRGKVTEQDLRSLGFGFRAKNIYKFLMIGSDLNLSDASDLLSITGIGDKIKDCILLYSNKDYDRIPMDVWMKKAKDKLYGKDFPWDSFKPYRGICQIYLYYYCRNNSHIF